MQDTIEFELDHIETCLKMNDFTLEESRIIFEQMMKMKNIISVLYKRLEDVRVKQRELEKTKEIIREVKVSKKTNKWFLSIGCSLIVIIIVAAVKYGPVIQYKTAIELPKVENRVEVLETGQKKHGEKIVRLEEKVGNVDKSVTDLKDAHIRFYKKYDDDQRIQQADIKTILLKVGGE